jgi:hypothetical protein
MLLESLQMLLFGLTFCWALLFAPVLSSRTPKHGISSGFPHKEEVHLEQYLPRDVGTIGTVHTAVSHRNESFVSCTRRRHCLLRCAVSPLAVTAFPSCRYLRQAIEAQWKTEKYGTFSRIEVGLRFLQRRCGDTGVGVVSQAASGLHTRSCPIWTDFGRRAKGGRSKIHGHSKK